MHSFTNKKRVINEGGDGDNVKRVKCPACSLSREGYHLQTCPHCESDYCSRPTCFPNHQATFINDFNGHLCCADSRQQCLRCGNTYCNKLCRGPHQLTFLQCSHCLGNFCGTNRGTHQATFALDSENHNCCLTSKKPCPVCHLQFCQTHKFGDHDLTFHECSHCGGNFCSTNLEAHQESFDEDAAEHDCCADSLEECSHCHENFCSAHSLDDHLLDAPGCGHESCESDNKECNTCGNFFCALCIVEESGVVNCEECDKKVKEKLKLEKEKLKLSSKSPSKSSTEISEKDSARHIPNTFKLDSKQSLTLLHLDVDQGACTLVLYTTLKGERWTAVIDGGHGNPGRGQIVRYLKSIGIEKIDALFLSHYDADHADGLEDLIFYHSTLLKEAILYVPHPSGGVWIKIKQVVPIVGKTIYEDDNFSILPVARDQGSNENTRSLSLLISLGKFKYLTCGDLPTEFELPLSVGVKQVDALFCSHHGSAHSTSEKMLDNLKKPPIAVISAGRNGYGHPNSETIERFPKEPENFRLYLTGCQFNRKYVNPKYYESERDNLTYIINEMWTQYNLALTINDAKNLAAVLIDGLLFCIEEKYEVENAKELNKTVLEILQSILNKDKTGEGFKEDLCERVSKMVQKCYEAKCKEDIPIIGVLSGTKERMGPVGIRIQSPYFDQIVDIGFCSDDGEWKWKHRWKRESERLVFSTELNESAPDIDKAIPEEDEKIPSSPGGFTGWHETRISARNPFSLSTRTPRQPVLVVEYKCRWCQKKGKDNMLLIACEFCRSKGYLIAYHEECLLSAMDGGRVHINKRGWFTGEKYLIKPIIEQLISQRDFLDVPVMIPLEYEACFFCGIFRNSGTYFIYADRRDVKDIVRTRRDEFKDEKLSEVKSGAINFNGRIKEDPKFKDFYELQPKI